VPGGLFPESSHHVVWTVSGPYLGKAGIDGERLTVRTGGHVGIPERIRRYRVFLLELVSELLGEATFLRLESSTRVVCHQTCETGGLPLVPKPPRTIERVQAGPYDVRRVTDVVQPSGSHQEVLVR